MCACLFFNTAHAEPTTEKKFLLITGCGRSGTQYMAKFLRKSGLKVGHERMKAHGTVSWLMASTADWSPWGPIASDYEFIHIFHQIRDPLKVIQSFYNVPPAASWEWISESIPQISMDDSDLVKCAKYWYYWNLLAESKAEWTYRIEDFDRVYIEIGKRLGITFERAILQKLSKETNTKGKPARIITWDILRDELPPDLFHKVEQLARKYKYLPPG
jgi:hypothetical protein